MIFIVCVHRVSLLLVYIAVDLAGILGGPMANAEGGSVPSGMGYGEGCHSSAE